MKRARKRAGYTQERVAEQMGVSTQTITAYEQGITDPPLKRLQEMGRLYGVSFII